MFEASLLLRASVIHRTFNKQATVEHHITTMQYTQTLLLAALSIQAALAMPNPALLAARAGGFTCSSDYIPACCKTLVGGSDEGWLPIYTGTDCES